MSIKENFDFTENDITYVDNNKTRIVTVIKSSLIITIPNSVISINTNAFQYSMIKTLIIPDSIIQIGPYAFSNCSALTSITINNSFITENQFNGCTSLQSIIIPFWVTEIGDSAFKNCSALTNIIIQNAIIGINQFYNCTSLQSITIPSWVTSIGLNAFNNCTALKTIILYCSKPNNITMSIKLFYNTPIQNVYAKDNTWHDLFTPLIRNNILRPKSIESTYYILNGIMYSDTSMYYIIKQTSPISNLIISDNVTKIASSAFSNSALFINNVVSNSSINSITIPFSVRYIGIYAFSECNNLTNIILNNSIIGEYQFSNCKFTNITIPNNIITIETGAFSQCTLLTSVTINNYIIGRNQFYKCTSLTNIIIPNIVADIGINAFAECTNLTKITINCVKPTYITTYNYLFYNSGISQIITMSGDLSWDTIKADIPKQK